MPCSARTVRTVDSSASDVGYYPSIAIGADGLALISYFNWTDQRIQVAHCEDTACDSSYLSVPKWENGGYRTSVAVGANGLGLIGLFDAFYHEMQIVHCLDIRCFSSKISTLGTVGLASTSDLSLAVGPDGRGLMSHVFNPGGGSPAFMLRVAHLPIGF